MLEGSFLKDKNKMKSESNANMVSSGYIRIQKCISDDKITSLLIFRSKKLVMEMFRIKPTIHQSALLVTQVSVFYIPFSFGDVYVPFSYLNKVNNNSLLL